MLSIVLFEWFVFGWLMLTLLLARCFSRTIAMTYSWYIRSILFFLVGLLLAALLLLPVNWVYWLHGVFGQFSAASVLLIGLLLLEFLSGKTICRLSEKQVLLAAIAIGGSIFYPFALGIGKLNPYNLGFGHSLMLFNCVVVALLCIVKCHWLSFYTILLAMGMQMLSVHESTNLWDYLLDGGLYLVSIGYWLHKLSVWCFTIVKRTDNH